MKKNIIFTLPAEALQGATKAVLLGDFNNWQPAKEFELKKQKNGSFKVTVSLEAGKTYQYRFLLDNGSWVNDYNAQEYVFDHAHGIDNCQIYIPITKKSTTDKRKTTTKKATAKKSATKAKKTTGPKVKKAASSGKTTAKSISAKKKPASVKAAKSGNKKAGDATRNKKEVSTGEKQ